MRARAGSSLFAAVTVGVLLTGGVTAAEVTANAGPATDPSLEVAVRLKDIGVLGLASHDLLSWDRATQTNVENTRFDLSTIFDYDGGLRWRTGGNPKNSENAPVYTITMGLVARYSDLANRHRAAGMNETDATARARTETVAHFVGLVRESYGRVFAEPFPEPLEGLAATVEEQASFRALHDILPGRMTLRRDGEVREVSVTDWRYAQTLLAVGELHQPVKTWDGAYDPEYLAIEEPTGTVVNLMAVDGAFIESQTAFRQADMLAELASVGRGEKPFALVSFAHLVRSLYAKGAARADNPWASW